MITEDAGAATPAIVEAIGSAGGEVTSAREYRPSFDEVFAELVQRRAADSPANGASGNGQPVRG